MNDDLKPNDRNFCFWRPEGAFMLSKLAILRLRDQFANEGPALDAVSALNAAADAIEEIEVAWTTRHRPVSPTPVAETTRPTRV